jgi:hypothetical protein
MEILVSLQKHKSVERRSAIEDRPTLAEFAEILP